MDNLSVNDFLLLINYQYIKHPKILGEGWGDAPYVPPLCYPEAAIKSLLY